MAKNQFLNWKNCQKCNFTKKIDLFDFTCFFLSGVFFNFLAHYASVKLGAYNLYIFIIISEATESTSVQETSLEMIKISMISSSTSTTEVPTQQTDHTIANDLESLPMDDQPVSLSQIHLDVPLED